MEESRGGEIMKYARKLLSQIIKVKAKHESASYFQLRRSITVVRIK